MKYLIVILLTSLFLFKTAFIEARVTPEDIVNAKREAYDQKVSGYSLNSKQRLESLAQQIAQINQERTGQLSRIMFAQGAILDEYIVRHLNLESSAQVEKVRYWITFAHEAVAYQAAKIYIFNLTSETNLKSDAKSLVNLFSGELNYARSKVIYSQQLLQELIK